MASGRSPWYDYRRNCEPWEHREVKAMKDIDPESFCPRCRKKHDAPEFIDILNELDETRKEIERLRAALQEIGYGTVNGEKNGGIMCRAIAKAALKGDKE